MIVPFTMYWDDKDKRYVLIVNQPPSVRHYKVPRECHERPAAIQWAKTEHDIEVT